MPERREQPVIETFPSTELGRVAQMRKNIFETASFYFHRYFTDKYDNPYQAEQSSPTIVAPIPEAPIIEPATPAIMAPKAPLSNVTDISQARSYGVPMSQRGEAAPTPLTAEGEPIDADQHERELASRQEVAEAYIDPPVAIHPELHE